MKECLCPAGGDVFLFYLFILTLSIFTQTIKNVLYTNISRLNHSHERYGCIKVTLN